MFFPGIGCLKAHLVYRSRMTISYTRCSKGVAYALQEPLKAELERLKQHQIIVHLGIDDTLEGCDSFVLGPKVNGKV